MWRRSDVFRRWRQTDDYQSSTDVTWRHMTPVSWCVNEQHINTSPSARQTHRFIIRVGYLAVQQQQQLQHPSSALSSIRLWHLHVSDIFACLLIYSHVPCLSSLAAETHFCICCDKLSNIQRSTHCRLSQLSCALRSSSLDILYSRS